MSGKKGLEENLFEQLGIAAREEGYPSVEKMEELADQFVFGKANVFGSASFYDFLQPENQGKKVYICNGSACLTAGTQPALREELLKKYKPEEIGEMCCFGKCYEAKGYLEMEENSSSPPRRTGGQAGIRDEGLGISKVQILTNEFTTIKEYYKLWEKVLKTSKEELLNELKVSGLRGRGGAGFPIATKLEGCLHAKGDIKFIVCNADEGDPGAFSDRYLLEERIHSVLLGMMIAGFITGASWGVVYIRGEYPRSIEICKNAIEELKQQQLIGENILGSGFNYQFKVITAQGAYICGEETALLSSIEGQRPEVRVRPPYPVQKGLFNKPTVVNNVETLACIPFIIEKGGAAFAKLGKGRSTGTKLVSLDSHFNKPGLYEVEMGTPLSTLVNEMAGGFRVPVKAMHIGGPLGGLVPVSKINDLTIDFESFAANGFLLGHASVVCIPEDFPLIKYLSHLFKFTAHESCGKCFPCRIGSTRGYEMLEKAQNEGYKIDPVLFNDLLETLEIGSLCALGGGLPLPVKNALQYFNQELSTYFKNA
ncbi:MAG: NAD(P)H-dependent oxidoreductase subunit E [Chitinophagaceae bacterium]|nr:NAD(P)H-dependent oxidoreductase subunit E [Chitinophagaceae bacterium]